MDAYNQKYKDSSLVNTFALNKPSVDLKPVTYSYQFHDKEAKKCPLPKIQPVQQSFVPVPKSTLYQAPDPSNNVPNSYYYGKYLKENSYAQPG